MELAEILKFIRISTDWLYTPIYQNNYFFLDYWSFVHFFSGLLLPVLIINFKIQRAFIVSFLILVFYEVIEISLIYFAFNVFRPETIKDQITDIVIGLSGMFVIYRIGKMIFHSEQKTNHYHFISAIFTSLTISFLWVGFYGYNYNYTYLNNSGLNLWAFGCWSLSLFIICNFFSKFRLRFSNKPVFYTISYLIYFSLLIAIEFIGYKVIGINEISHANSKSLIFNLIHGTPVLHLYYLSAPIIVILIYKKIYLLLQNYFNTDNLNSIKAKRNPLRSATIAG